MAVVAACVGNRLRQQEGKSAFSIGTSSHRLIEAEVSLSPPITWQGRVQRSWSKLQPHELDRRASRLLRLKQLK